MSTQIIGEKVNVILASKTPVSLSWRGRDYKITKIGLHHNLYEGKMMQISIIGYKGQGVKTLSRILSRAGLLAGMISEDFSESGNIVKAYVRIDKQQMLEKGPIKNADFMIVLDHSLFSSKEVKENNFDNHPAKYDIIISNG